MWFVVALYLFQSGGPAVKERWGVLNMSVPRGAHCLIIRPCSWGILPVAAFLLLLVSPVQQYKPESGASPPHPGQYCHLLVKTVKHETLLWHWEFTRNLSDTWMHLLEPEFMLTGYMSRTTFLNWHDLRLALKLRCNCWLYSRSGSTSI